MLPTLVIRAYGSSPNTTRVRASVPGTGAIVGSGCVVEVEPRLVLVGAGGAVVGAAAAVVVTGAAVVAAGAPVVVESSVESSFPEQPPRRITAVTTATTLKVPRRIGSA